MKRQKGNNHQRNRALKEARRKAAVAVKKREQAAAPHSGLHLARAAASTSGVDYCMVSESLFDVGIGCVILGRAVSSTKIATSFFLVDVYCLGVKDAFYSELTNGQFREMMDSSSEGGFSLAEIAPECARKIVESAVAYARQLGFNPHPDYSTAEALFGDIDAEASPIEYEFGKDGKPFYISGTRDTPMKVRKTLHALISRLGEKNFRYILEAGTF